MAIDRQRLLLYRLVPVLFAVATTSPFTPVMRTTCGFMWDASDLKLTCYFPEDLNATKTDFTVYRYKKGLANQISPDGVVSCMWSDGKNVCTKMNGYDYDGVIHPGHVNIIIRNATEQHFGRYECHVPGYTDNGVCYPHLQPPPVMRTSCGFIWEASDLKLTCYFPEDLNATKTDFTVYRYKEELANQISHGVVSCMWSDGKNVCTKMPGYDYDGVIHPGHVNIIIHNATEQHFGRYECHVPGYTDNEVCYPHLQPPPQMYSSNTQKTATTESQAGVQESLDGHQMQRQTSQEPDSITAAADANKDSGQPEAGIITRAVVGPLAVIVVTLIICFLVKRSLNKTPRKSNDDINKKKEEDEGKQLLKESIAVQEQGDRDRSDPINLTQHEGDPIDLTQHEGDPIDLTQHEADPSDLDLTQRKSDPSDLTQHECDSIDPTQHEADPIDLTQHEDDPSDLDLTQHKSDPIDLTQHEGDPIDLTQHEGDPIDLTQHEGDPIDLTQHEGDPIDLTQSVAANSHEQLSCV